MASDSFFGDTLELTIQTASGTALTVATLKGVEIKGEWDHKELYGQDSVLREDVARVAHKVPITIKSAKFHPNIIGKILGTETADKDIDGVDSSGNTQATVIDSNTVPLFDASGNMTGKSGVEYVVLVEDIYFEGAPWAAPDGDWSVLDLSGVGRKMTTSYQTV